MRIAVASKEDQNVLLEGEIEIGPAATGVIRLKMDDGSTLISHIDLVLPLDEEAEDRMKNGYTKRGKAAHHG